ncbi:MAG: peptidoglycan DD-metalloendopeptidase family protein [Zoogloeaceae bacterium]|nr:peptidoglycan DD-metalloendopeptidase family protein [Zoogloeaceae bacterium]
MMRKSYFRRFRWTALAAALLLGACASQTPAPVIEHSSNIQFVGPGYHIVKKGETLYGIALEHGQDYRDVAGWNYLTDPNHIIIGQSLRVWPPGATSAAGSEVASAAPVSTGAVVEQRGLEGTPSAWSETSNTSTLKREPRGNREPYSDARHAALEKNPPQMVATAAVPSVAAASATETRTTTPVPATAAATTAAAGKNMGGILWSWPANGKVIGNFAQNKGLEIGGKAGDPVLAAADGRVVYTGNSLRGYGNLVIIKHNSTYLTAYAHNQKILVKEGQTVQRGTKIAEMGNTDSDVVKLHFEVRNQGNPVEPLNYLPKK